MKINPIKDLIHFGEPIKEPFGIDYRLTTKCNYNCPYCKDLHDNKNKFKKFDSKDWGKLADFLCAIERPKIVFLYGGEPSVHPQFIDVVKCIDYCMDEASVLEIQTNLSMPLSTLKELDRCNRTRWCVSYHYGQIKNDVEFLTKVQFLSSIGRLGNVCMMYQKEYRDEIVNLYCFFKKMGIATELLPLLCGSLREIEDKPFEELNAFYNDERVRLLTKHEYVSRNDLRIVLKDNEILWTSPLELWYRKQNTFKGMMCNISRERITIDHTGGCYKCFNEIFESTKPTLNIYEDFVTAADIKKYIKNLRPMKCPFDKCFFELSNNKWRGK